MATKTQTPKPTTMTREAIAADLVERNYVKPVSAWDDLEGQEFGGQNPILILKPDEMAGPFIYHGHQEVTTDLGATTVHLGADEEGQVWRLPIQATFIRAVDQAALRHGDKFVIRRDEDVEKKRGKGAGNAMAIFRIKVFEKAASGGDVSS